MPGWLQRRSALLSLCGLALAVLVAFGNAWPDRLVHDDRQLARSEMRSEPGDVLRYFREDLWASRGVETGFYRPLLQVSVWVDHRLYGDWAAGLHLSTIAWHLLATCILFGFLREWLGGTQRATHPETWRTDYAACLAALVFAVHPVHTEVVNSVYNRSEILVTVAGLAGLWWLLRRLPERPVVGWSGFALAFCLALFAKETAIVLPGIALGLVVLDAPWRLRVQWSRTWPAVCLLVPLGAYLALRATALTPVDTGAAPDARSVVAALPIDGLPGHTVWLRASGVWAEGFRLLLWPYPLKLYYETPSDLVQWLSVPLHAGLVAWGVVRHRRGHGGLLAGLLVYYLALLPSSRLFASGGEYPHLAERYLYLASVGLSLWLAGALFRPVRSGRWLQYATLVLCGVVFIPLCWLRNADWSDEQRLYEADYRHGSRGVNAVRLLTSTYLQSNQTQEAVNLCDRHLDLQDADGRVSNNCAVAYNRVGREADAVNGYLRATRDPVVATEAHLNLAQIDLRHGRRQAARARFDLAIASEADPAMKAYQRAVALVIMDPDDVSSVREAREHLLTALRLRPNLAPARGLLSEIDRALEGVQ